MVCLNFVVLEYRWLVYIGYYGNIGWFSRWWVDGWGLDTFYRWLGFGEFEWGR